MAGKEDFVIVSKKEQEKIIGVLQKANAAIDQAMGLFVAGSGEGTKKKKKRKAKVTTAVETFEAPSAGGGDEDDKQIASPKAALAAKTKATPKTPNKAPVKKAQVKVSKSNGRSGFAAPAMPG